ncbi:signal peptidase I [Apilactobacillus micheneri]|uniref:Signal peptidase I n=1 Tax=Apilactobacillus micheneri TaxID=1899430 RepID=A0A9Q8IMC2_9LACO|nr:signal peptidase I [Apilactobacillus micheneri]TPR39984.1 signal peptidase I [Apilactobacillus micheneri]TPR41795.1 signal peptidase I [Apilactobacillus micheneri]TPR44186.1 signal peptidase I [Apilactobacillus micheneri]TPR45810.1 signal peptidase I [Apilactobacillus micheneri]TPR50554.1 signal peptidase I [Apilactobacillus micheneri]
MNNRLLKNSLYLLVYIVIGVILYFIISHFVTTVKVEGNSMYPNLVNKERVILFPQAKVKRNSVIVFDAHSEDSKAVSNDDYVKRVIGMPGDHISFKDHQIYINGKDVKQNYISKFQQQQGSEYSNDNGHLKDWNIAKLSETKWEYNKNATVVPKGEYFVMGDNRAISNDSRYWGFVKKDKILGVAHTLPWSTNKTTRHNINDLAE